MTEKSNREFPFIIRPENVSRYEDGEVFILDRRVYPFDVKFVHCKTYEDTAKAIEDMVTQSGGPGIAAGQGMIQAARQASHLSAEGIAEALDIGAKRLARTRPTHNQIRVVTTQMLNAGLDALSKGLDVEKVLLSFMENEVARRHKVAMLRGKAGASVLKDGDCIMNHCWAESGIIYTLYAALEAGMNLTAFCSETRPYLQGARLTADAIAEMGIPTTVVTDNMPGFIISKGMVSVFMSGADRVSMSGHVFNKIGTFQIALAAHHYQVPYYAFSSNPDPDAPKPEDVEIEERDPQEVLHCLGVRTATHRAKGYYPAFDITPPEFVSAVITHRGVFSPYDLVNYYNQ
jgi:methylthioribose-1-phosphate isomerase